MNKSGCGSLIASKISAEKKKEQIKVHVCNSNDVVITLAFVTTTGNYCCVVSANVHLEGCASFIATKDPHAHEDLDFNNPRAAEWEIVVDLYNANEEELKTISPCTVDIMGKNSHNVCRDALERPQLQRVIMFSPLKFQIAKNIRKLSGQHG